MKKIISLIKTIKNPSFLSYRIYHNMNKMIPLNKAKKISFKNDKYYLDKKIDIFKIETYDGSNQMVHPDIIFWKDKYWLVGTPYPYGMEEYENPSIYTSDNFDNFESIIDNPIVNQGKIRKGKHLSDPVLFVYKDELYCFYRKTIKEKTKVTNIIYSIKINENLELSENPKKVLESTTEGLLSPSIYIENDKIIMFVINQGNNNSEIVKFTIDRNFHIIDRLIVKSINIPSDYYAWHLGMNPATFNDGLREALFLLRSKINRNKFLLYYAKLVNNNWEFECEAEIPNEIKSEIKTPYKSCFIPNSNKILLSFRDTKDRYYLYKMENIEEAKNGCKKQSL